MAPTLIFLDKPTAREYFIGETQGRKDGACKWGMADTSTMTENKAIGYLNGYSATIGL